MDDEGKHAVICQMGGGPTKRHNAVRDALYDWFTGMGRQAGKEMDIPDWGRWNAKGEWERAVLDVVYHDIQRGRVCVDVAVVDGAGWGVGRSVAWALRRREQAKHRRYK